MVLVLFTIVGAIWTVGYFVWKRIRGGSLEWHQHLILAAVAVSIANGMLGTSLPGAEPFTLYGSVIGVAAGVVWSVVYALIMSLIWLVRRLPRKSPSPQPEN